jgi:hypothetical protein
MTPRPLREALQLVLALPATNPGQQVAQREITSTLEAALDARRQRIIVSRAEVNAVKWSCLYLQAICALLAIALVHRDDRLSSLVATGLFATGVSASVLLIAAHDRPFVGQAPSGTLDVNRDTLANCPAIAMNAGEFGRANRSDHHVLQFQRPYRQESSHEGRGGFCHLAHDGQARWFR